MSKKISDFFKTHPKCENDLKRQKEAKIRDCRVVVKDIQDECDKGREKNFFEKTLKINSKSKKIFSCKFFDKNFNLKYKLNRHTKLKHLSENIEPFECDFDGKVFKTKGIIYNHMKVHLPNAECHICHKTLKSNYLYRHLKITHKTGQNFECKICSKIFKTAQYLHEHEKTHNKKFQCEICKNMHSSQYRLNEHNKLYHENSETYKCEKCSKEFRRKDHLMRHQKTHDKNRPKPFKCQRCDFATDNKNWIKKHEKFHEKKDKKFAAMKNPLKCEKCPTLCKNKDALWSHVKQVHPEVQFQCDLCAKLIKIKKNFITHMNAHIL